MVWGLLQLRVTVFYGSQNNYVSIIMGTHGPHIWVGSRGFRLHEKSESKILGIIVVLCDGVDPIFYINFNFKTMSNYSRILLGFMGLCALGLMGIGYTLGITAPFVLGTVIGVIVTVIGIVDAVMRERYEEDF